MSVYYPHETASYRDARKTLLQEEIALRNQTEKVAALRRDLPDGGRVPEDYTFTSLNGSPVKMSNMFTTGRKTLVIYSLMYRPDADAPCPMCTSMIDGLAGQARHLGQLIDFAIVAAATPEQLKALSDARGWGDLYILSAHGTTYQRDYNAETEDGAQHPMINVFRKRDDGIHHFWGSEAYWAKHDGQPRHADPIWPLWNILDLTPHGRDEDWYPGLTYTA